MAPANSNQKQTQLTDCAFCCYDSKNSSTQFLLVPTGLPSKLLYLDVLVHVRV